MDLIKIKAKVRLMSEDDMELEEMDLGVIATSKSWVWKNIGIASYQIYKIIEYNKTKSIVEMYSGEKLLVQESFEELYNRWAELSKDLEEPENNNEASEEISEDEEE